MANGGQHGPIGVNAGKSVLKGSNRVIQGPMGSLSPMVAKSYVPPKSHGPKVPWSQSPTVPKSHVPKVPCAQRPMVSKSHGPNGVKHG